MDLNTLEKLAKNPHYKMSAKQREELERLRNQQEPMIHDFEFDKTVPKVDKQVPRLRKPNANRRNASRGSMSVSRDEPDDQKNS